MFTSSTKGAQFFTIIFMIGTIFGLTFYNLTLNNFLLVLGGYFLYGCLGIVVTFHRLLTHQGFTTSQFISRLFSLLGCFGGTGSPLAWVAIHINHHLKSDKPGDPHSPMHKGLKIFMLNYEQEIVSTTKWRMRNIITNPYYQFLHRYYFLLLISWSMLLFGIGGAELMIFLHWIPALLTIVMSNVVNYVGHRPQGLGAYRRYNLSDQSTNNWLWAVPSWGESWHNTHHRFPKKYNLSERWWEIDISGLIIKLIKK